MSFGESGYSFVVDRSGELIAHPLYSSEEDAEFLRRNNYGAVTRLLFEQRLLQVLGLHPFEPTTRTGMLPNP